MDESDRRLTDRRACRSCGPVLLRMSGTNIDLINELLVLAVMCCRSLLRFLNGP